MLITLRDIQYSEKNPIKKLNFKNSFNMLSIRCITYFRARLPRKVKSITAQINSCKTDLIYKGLFAD